MKLNQISKNNKGFTLVEFLVGVAIISVIVTFTSLSISIQPATIAKSAANELNSILGRSKNATLTKTGDIYIKISEENDVINLYYYENDILITTQKLASHGVKMSYKTSSGTSYLDSSKSLYIAFDRRAGGFQTLTQAAALASASGTGTAVEGNLYCTELTFTGASVEHTIKLGTHTGTHYILE